MIDYNLNSIREEWKANWQSKGVDADRRVCGMDDHDFDIILGYICKYKPKHILEYGSGESTYIINKQLEELGYGGKITSYENNQYWYNKIKTGGLDDYNSVIYAECNLLEERILNKVCVRYEHPLEHLADVDLVLLDGPDLRAYNPCADVTINLMDLVNYTGNQIPFYVDGRRGTQQFYDQLGYTRDIEKIML